MLTPTDIYGTAHAILINDTPDTDLQSRPLDQVEVTWDGFAGESHGGQRRPSCSRVLKQYPKRGTEIRNARQISILAVEELAEIARRMEIPRIAPEWVGANLALEGIPDLTQLPPSSRLIFENGTSLVVDIENGPCRFPAEILEAHFPGKGAAFPRKALGLRGVVAWVERPGTIAVGDRCRLHVPPARIYAHTAPSLQPTG
ncbi:MAG: MOSC domain-containing protein [Pseudomonadota bacterium]